MSVNENETTIIGNGMPVIEEEFAENDLRQVWIRGKPDENGYFKISNPDSKKFLTGAYENGLTIEGEEMVFCYQNCSDLLWEKNCSSDWEKLLKFGAKGREFSKTLRSQEQFIQTVKGQNNLL